MAKTLPEPNTLEALEQILPVFAEKLAVTRRKVHTGTVRLDRTTKIRQQRIQEELALDQVVVERVPIGRVVTETPAVREEGDTTIYSVVEEVLVVERRLVLKEELHVRRIKSTKSHVEDVDLREQQVVITRTPDGPATSLSAASASYGVPPLTDLEE